MFLSFLFSWFVIDVLTSQNVGSGVTGVAFHPTKNLVASCSYDNSVKLWNVDTGAELWTVTGHRYFLFPDFFRFFFLSVFQSDL